MNTLATKSFLSEIQSQVPKAIPIERLAYFRARLRNRLFELIIGEFIKQRDGSRQSQASVALRLSKRPEQINRWLSAPGNLTLDTVSDLLLAISGGELSLAVKKLDDGPVNSRGPAWTSRIAVAGGTSITDPNALQLADPVKFNEQVIETSKSTFNIESYDHADLLRSGLQKAVEPMLSGI